MDRKPLLRDIAAAAHVSEATASKVLKGRSGPSAATKTHVLEAARALGWSPSASRHRREWSTGIIGLITTELDGCLSLPILAGAENTLGATRHTAFLANSRGDGMIERRHIERLRAAGIDGLLLVSASADPRPALPRELTGDIPTVYVYGPSRASDDCSVVFDFEQAGYDAIDHLARHGRSRIAVIAGRDDRLSTRQRLSGMNRAFADHGLKPASYIRFGVWQSSWGREATRLLLDDGVHFDALYCFNDRIASGAIETLLERGIAVPDDVMVIGQDNWHTEFLSSRVSITSIDSACGDIGHAAARQLLDALDGKPHHGITTIRGAIVERDSTRPASS